MAHWAHCSSSRVKKAVNSTQLAESLMRGEHSQCLGSLTSKERALGFWASTMSNRTCNRCEATGHVPHFRTDHWQQAPFCEVSLCPPKPCILISWPSTEVSITSFSGVCVWPSSSWSQHRLPGFTFPFLSKGTSNKLPGNHLAALTTAKPDKTFPKTLLWWPTSGEGSRLCSLQTLDCVQLLLRAISRQVLLCLQVSTQSWHALQRQIVCSSPMSLLSLPGTGCWRHLFQS